VKKRGDDTMDTTALEKAVSDALETFHKQRLLAAQKLQALHLLGRKNPYLYRALGYEVAAELMSALLESHLKESDETIFGNTFFEPLALLASGGHKSEAPGVDVVLETEHKILAVAVKSGPNVFNASQKRRQNTEFNALRSRLQQTHKAFDPLLGHGYGRFISGPSDSKNYRDSSGQAFWEEITGDADFYLKLTRLMMEVPLRHREEFNRGWSAIVNRLTLEFSEHFCHPEGSIDWERLTAYVSAREKPLMPKKRRPRKTGLLPVPPEA
jgi:hypothetical protein